jgi:hypothetical protein
MASINLAPSDNLGSLKWIQWAGTPDFSAITNDHEGTIKTVTFLGGKEWAFGYFSFETLEYEEEQATSASGEYFKQEIKGFIPGENKAQMITLEGMRYKRFIIVMKDMENNIRMVGSTIEGARLKIRYGTRSKVSGLKGTLITFYLETAKRAPFVDSAVLFIDPVVV